MIEKMSNTFVILSVIAVVSANHFRGGTITWKPVNNNVSSTSIVSVMITQTYLWTRTYAGCNDSMITDQNSSVNLGGKAGTGAYLNCTTDCNNTGGYIGNEVPITGYCTDYSTILELTVSQRSDIVNLTAGSSFIAAFATSGGWQLLALGNSTGWSLSVRFDLNLRSDNGLINTPPVATCISYISVPLNIQTTIQIPVLDADNDVIRCRFANGTSECVNACPPGSLPNGTTLSSSCELTITGTTAGAYYLVAVQVEDFISNTSTIAMSSVPIQFLIYVYNTTVCTLEPILTSDVSNDECLSAQVGRNFTVKFTVINQCGAGRTVMDIATLSFPFFNKGPLVQSSTNSSVWFMTVSWFPSSTQVGSQVFCAVAVDNTSVQSDQYCFRVLVSLTNDSVCPGVISQLSEIVVLRKDELQRISSRLSTISATTFQTTSMNTEARTSSELITTEITTETTTSATSDLSIYTSSSILATTLSGEKTAEINLPMIIGVSIAFAILSVCCACCYWYFLLLPAIKKRRNRTKTKKEMKNDLWNRRLVESSKTPRSMKNFHFDSYSMTTDHKRSILTSIKSTNTESPNFSMDDVIQTKIRQQKSSNEFPSSDQDCSSRTFSQIVENQRKFKNVRIFRISRPKISDLFA